MSIFLTQRRDCICGYGCIIVFCMRGTKLVGMEYKFNIEIYEMGRFKSICEKLIKK